jgi:hypothetical protein
MTQAAHVTGIGFDAEHAGSQLKVDSRHRTDVRSDIEDIPDPVVTEQQPEVPDSAPVALVRSLVPLRCEGGREPRVAHRLEKATGLDKTSDGGMHGTSR